MLIYDNNILENESKNNYIALGSFDGLHLGHLSLIEKVKGLAKESVYEMTGVKLDATLSGQRIFKKEVLEIFDEIPFGYGVEVGMTIDILKNNFKIEEVLVNKTHSET